MGTFTKLKRLLLFIFIVHIGIWAEAPAGTDDIKETADSAGTNSEAEETDPLWWTLFRNFAGGVMLEGTIGGAEVESSVEKNGKSQVVASGDADQSGFKVAFNRPPEGTEFFWRLSPNYFQQKITIADFQRNIDQPTESESTQIETVVTEYGAGQVLDPNSPNKFDIRLKSGGIDFLLGGSMFLPYIDGESEIVFIEEIRLDISAGISLIEYRDTFVDFGVESIQDTSWTFLQSWRVGGAVNIGDPNFPLKYRFSVFYQSYLDVEYPRKLEFRSANVTYNEEINAYQRDRVFVSGFKLTHITARFSIFYVF